MPVSISEFVPRDYQRSAERERLFLQKLRKTTHEYDIKADMAIEYICTKRYRNRPDLGYFKPRQYIQLHYQGKSSRVLFSDEATRLRFIKLIEDPQIKLILIRFNYLTKTTPHALALVIDKIAKRVEFYEPNGVEGARRHQGNVKIHLVMEFLKKPPALGGVGLGMEYQPMRWDQTCSRYGVQMLEGVVPRAHGEIGGYCVIWSVFLMELRIRDPRKTPAEAQNDFMRQIMRRVIPTMALENEEVNAVMKLMYSWPTQTSGGIYDRTKAKYFKTTAEAEAAGKRIGKEFREFIKNYMSHLDKLMNAAPSTAVVPKSQPSPRPAPRPVLPTPRPVLPTPRCQSPTSRCRSRSPMYSRAIGPQYRGSKLPSIRYSRPAGPSPRLRSRSRSRETQKQKLSGWIDIPPGSQKLIIRFK